MTFKLDLTKEELRKEVKICLEKAKFDTESLSSKVAFVLDESGSMREHYVTNQQGQSDMTGLLDRMLAVSFFFDDDGDIDMFAFNHEGRQLASADQDSYGTYQFAPDYGGTEFTGVFNLVKDYYYGGSVKKASKLGRFFGGKDKVTVAKGRSDSNDSHPVYVFFLTDGASQSPGKDLKTLTNLMADHDDLYLQIIGIGHARMTMVEQLARDNSKQCSFLRVSDLTGEGDGLLEKLITPEVRAVIQAK